MRIVLHNKTPGKSLLDAQARAFLVRQSIPYYAWNGTFSADSKMAKSFEVLRGVHAHDTLILQMDVDEEPDPVQLRRALRELEAQRCDAVFAYWQDHLAEDGGLAHVDAKSGSAPLVQQFPLRCSVSGKVVRGGKTTKTIAYRADSRLDGGQHDVWCDRSGLGVSDSSGLTGAEWGVWNRTFACRQHAHERAKGRLLPLILAHTPNLAARPRYCPTKVALRHYKFVWGVEAHLQARLESYKKQGLHWWRDSSLFLKHLREHDGKVCVHCPGMGCIDTRTGNKIQENPSEQF